MGLSEDVHELVEKYKLGGDENILLVNVVQMIEDGKLEYAQEAYEALFCVTQTKGWKWSDVQRDYDHWKKNK